MLADIPTPEVLSPDRVSRDDSEDMTTEDHRSQKQLLAKALEESCSYAEQLWQNLAAMRQYLYDSLPHEEPAGAVVSAVPHGPEDEHGWQRWQTAFGTTTSVLCGPHGDSGFGSQDARVLSQSARQLVVTSSAADPDVDSDRGKHEVGSATEPQQDGDTGRDPEEDQSADSPPPSRIGNEPVLAAVGKPVLYAVLGAVIAAATLRGAGLRS